MVSVPLPPHFTASANPNSGERSWPLSQCLYRLRDLQDHYGLDMLSCPRAECALAGGGRPSLSILHSAV